MSSSPNRQGANGRYLPGVKLPDNINAIPDIETVAKDADILIFNFPHQVCGCNCLC
jgi:glycerol-3-phosphate dehydrogenase (NAD+)